MLDTRVSGIGLAEILAGQYPRLRIGCLNGTDQNSLKNFVVLYYFHQKFCSADKGLRNKKHHHL